MHVHIKITSLSSIFMQRQEGWFCGWESDAGLERSGFYSSTFPLWFWTNHTGPDPENTNAPAKIFCHKWCQWTGQIRHGEKRRLWAFHTLVTCLWNVKLILCSLSSWFTSCTHSSACPIGHLKYEDVSDGPCRTTQDGHQRSMIFLLLLYLVWSNSHAHFNSL